MTSAALPLPDLPQMTRDVRALIEIESPSEDLAAVGRVQDRVETWMHELGAQTRRLPGQVRQFTFGEASRPALILMHADTVWPHGTLASMPFRTEGERLYGPGSYDMKGGIVSALHALRLLQAGGWPAGGIEVLLSADEETGSLLSREAVEAAARRARCVLVVEPPVGETHALKTGRKGVGMYSVRVTGVAAHAGNLPEQGASAISEAARLLLEAQALARPERGTTVSVGRIMGGGAVNVIPAHAEFDADLRVSVLEEAERLRRGFEALRPHDPRARLTLSGGLNRPPFERLAGTAALYAQAQRHAHVLGFEVQEAFVGGGSDGNYTAPLSPTLDGLGAPGDGAHAAHEHIRLDRWPQHAALLAALLRDPGVE
ncbi:M20 family metallopeptidase [Deinococcus sp.]|uniref:M20 family metallopeptidase n=1 Tax=Deinococcus sp. TaxID=47478 RepID=UPI003CC5CF6A